MIVASSLTSESSACSITAVAVVIDLHGRDPALGEPRIAERDHAEVQRKQPHEPVGGVGRGGSDSHARASLHGSRPAGADAGRATATLEPYAVARGSDDARASDDAPARALARDGFALALVLAAAIVAYRPLLALGHLGWDTYPLILTSRIAERRGFLRRFREELMDGRYPHGHFYRPVTTLSFALDHAAWGLDAFGYHLDPARPAARLHARGRALGHRLLGPGVGTLAAALLFALHPLHVETLPVAARRADSLAQLFTLLALVVAPDAAVARQPRWRTGLCALCAALAVGSKETGVTRGAAAVCASARRIARPCRGASACAPRCAPARSRRSRVGLVLLVRAGVLGGLGGHPESSLLAGVGRGLALAPLYAHLLCMPQPLVSDPALARGLVAAGAAALAAALAALARGIARVRSLLLVCGVWLARRRSGSTASRARSLPGTRSACCRRLRCWSAPSRRARPAGRARVAARAPRSAPSLAAC